MGDVFFDLANFAINHELDAEGRQALLAAYFGDVGPAQERALDLMRFMSDFREAMWGVVQSVVSRARRSTSRATRPSTSSAWSGRRRSPGSRAALGWAQTGEV